MIRYSVFLLCFLLLFLALFTVQGQSTAPSLQRRASLLTSYIRFDSLLHSIGRQTGIKFSLNTRKYHPGLLFYLHKGSRSVGAILTEIERSTGIRYTVLGDHVIFVDGAPAPRKVLVHAVAAASVRSRKVILLHLPPLASTHIAADSRRVPLEPVYVDPVADSSALVRTGDSVYRIIVRIRAPMHILTSAAGRPIAWRTDMAVAPASLRPGVSRDTIIASPRNIRSSSAAKVRSSGAAAIRPLRDAGRRSTSSGADPFFAPDLFVRGGLSAGELFYVNPTVQAGLPFLYGILSWSSNFTVSGIRYGVGSSVSLSPDWFLHLNFTTGNNAKDFYKDTAGGVPPLRTTVKTRTQIFGLLGEKKFGNNLTLQFGPTLNIQRTIYYFEGQEAPLLLPESVADSQYRFLRPPYTMSNSYSPNSSRNTKIWIGFQLSFFYNLQFNKRG